MCIAFSFLGALSAFVDDRVITAAALAREEEIFDVAGAAVSRTACAKHAKIPRHDCSCNASAALQECARGRRQNRWIMSKPSIVC
jgi:hypothetical protein